MASILRAVHVCAACGSLPNRMQPEPKARSCGRHLLERAPGMVSLPTLQLLKFSRVFVHELARVISIKQSALRRSVASLRRPSAAHGVSAKPDELNADLLSFLSFLSLAPQLRRCCRPRPCTTRPRRPSSRQGPIRAPCSRSVGNLRRGITGTEAWQQDSAR